MQGSRYTHSLFRRSVEKVIVIKSATSKCDPSRQARPQLISTKNRAPNAAVSRWKMAPSCESTFPCQNFFTCYVGVVLHGLSSHVLLYSLHGHGASLQFLTCSPLIVNFCGGSLWFLTCSSLLVTWAWCFFAVLHMLSFNCKFLWWFFVVLHMLFFTCYMDVVLLCSSSHDLLYLYLGVDLLCLFT
jgi:hypothetical protein